MRSLVCCGVSRTVWARTGDGNTSIASKVLVAKQQCDARSLTGCMRIDDPPVEYTGRRPKSIRDFQNCGAFSWRALLMARIVASRPWRSEPSEKTAAHTPACGDY